MTKRRLSASVDARLLSAAEALVKRGSATSISAWVSAAMERQVEHERRLNAMDDLLADYGKQFGPITVAEMDEAERWARRHAIHVGPGLKKRQRQRQPGRGA